MSEWWKGRSEGFGGGWRGFVSEREKGRKGERWVNERWKGRSEGKGGSE